MKRLICLLLILALLPLFASGESAMPALYKARLARGTFLRAEPSMDSARLDKVPDGESVLVHVWAEDWCLCSRGDCLGYLPTDRLYEWWRLSDAPLPGYVPDAGVAVMRTEAVIAVEGYGGNTLRAGDQVAVRDESGRLAMMRGETSLPEGTYAYEPFVPPETAEPGDLLWACTTFYGGDPGPLESNRQANIALAVERISGVTLLPGEEFSFNRYCAPYNKQNGYLKAPNISRKGYGVSGGVCQVSTTIFGAVLGLELELDEWYVHRRTGVKYVSVGLDAAVSSWHDFRFTNSLSFPITLTILPQCGALTVLMKRGPGALPLDPA